LEDRKTNKDWDHWVKTSSQSVIAIIPIQFQR
jgi:hypothetical protein